MTGGQNGKVKVWEDDGNLTRTLQSSGFIQCLKILPNGNLISGSFDSSMVIWNLTSGEKVFDWPINTAHTSAIFAFEVIDDLTVASASRDSYIKFWNFLNGSQTKYIKDSAGVSTLLRLQNGSLISGDDSAVGNIRIWELENGTLLNTLKGHTNRINALEMITNEVLASGSQDGWVILWNLLNGQQINKLTRTPASEVWSLKKLCDNSIASGYSDHYIYVWSATNQTTSPSIIYPKDHLNIVEALDLLNENTLLSGSLDAKIDFWNISSGTLLKSILSDSPIYSLLHYDGNLKNNKLTLSHPNFLIFKNN